MTARFLRNEWIRAGIGRERRLSKRNLGDQSQGSGIYLSIERSSETRRLEDSYRDTRIRMIKQIKGLGPQKDIPIASEPQPSANGSVDGCDTCGTRRISPNAWTVRQIAVTVVIHDGVDRVRLTGLKFTGH